MLKVTKGPERLLSIIDPIVGLFKVHTIRGKQSLYIDNCDDKVIADCLSNWFMWLQDPNEIGVGMEYGITLSDDNKTFHKVWPVKLTRGVCDFTYIEM